MRSGESSAVVGPSLGSSGKARNRILFHMEFHHPAVSSLYYKVKVQSHGMLARVDGIQGVRESNKSRQQPVNHHGVKVIDCGI